MDETNENNETAIVHNYKNGSEIKQESDSNEQQEDGNHHSLPTVDGIMADVGVSANSASKSSRWAERLSTAAGVAGNMMEWYDFAVFGKFDVFRNGCEFE